MNDYDIVEYPHRPIAQAHPDRFAVVAALHGLEPAPLSTSRVLELGCGSGGNLIPLADLNPAASFFGVDLSDAAIAQGQKRIDALGLRNLRLAQMDVMDFPTDAGEFDYIIAHGLFSWVPQPVREKVLDICRRHLAPQGIAYVSYNTYPGCHLRAMWRDMMQFHTAQFDDRQTRIDQARSLIHLVAHGTGQDDAAHRLAQEEDARCAAIADSGIFHDDLAEVWQPFYIREFAGLAAAHALQFVGEAVLGDMLPVGIDGPAREALDALEQASPIAYQQYLDFFRIRRFRRTLLCRDGRPLRRRPDPDAMRRFHYSAQLERVAVDDPHAPPGSCAFRNRLNDVTVTTGDPLHAAALERLLGAWPSTLGFAALGVGDGDTSRFCAMLLDCLASSFLNVHLEGCSLPREAGERPEVWRVTRLEAALGNTLPSMHLGIVQIEDASVRRQLAACDGSHTRAELIREYGGAENLASILARAANSAILAG
jgi:SAM-dependent methyltransferase